MLEINPIGVVRSELKKPTLRAGSEGLTLEQRLEEGRAEHRRQRALVSEIVLEPEHEPRLAGIDGFSHVMVLYWPHLVPAERRGLVTVNPMGRKEFPEVGVFATCSPARPNPVLTTVVRLLSCRGAVLEVQGLEAVDGSPVIDLKPYNPGYLRVKDPVLPDWMEQIRREMDDVD
jgi:tRNA-Thr(GGU) m(6)t(6)A37 methyltransferase TsaA